MTLATHRPRSVGEIVDATFHFYRANAATMVTVAMIVAAPPAILKAILPAAAGRIVELAGNLLLPIAQGAIAAIVAAAIERDERLDVGGALSSVSGRTGSLIAVQIASGLMVFIGMVCLVVPGVIALIWTATSIPVVMIEQTGYARAIDRSRALARGKWKHVLGTVLLSWGLAVLILFGAGFVAGIFSDNDRFTNLVADLLFGLVFPIPAIAMTFLYYDLRVRSESADLDAMVSALPAATPTA
jgi:hypothetical protein